MVKNRRQNVPKSDFQSQFLTSKILLIFLKKFWLQYEMFLSNSVDMMKNLHMGLPYGPYPNSLIQDGKTKMTRKKLHFVNSRSFEALALLN